MLPSLPPRKRSRSGSSNISGSDSSSDSSSDSDSAPANPTRAVPASVPPVTPSAPSTLDVAPAPPPMLRATPAPPPMLMATKGHALVAFYYTCGKRWGEATLTRHHLGSYEETPVKVSSGVGGGEVNEALQDQLKVLSWTIERERAARIAACRKAERGAVLALRPIENPSAPAAVERRRAATLLDQELAKLHSEWTLSVARSGLVKFPDDPAKYGRALQQHKEKQREVRRQLEERLVSLQAEARAQLLLHRPWRCVEADLAAFPKPELAQALSSPVEVGTLRYPAPSSGQTDDTVYVTRQQLDKLRELVTELKSDDVKLELKPLDVCAA